MKNLLILFLFSFCLSAFSQPLNYEQRYQRGYLSTAEVKANLCCPCDNDRLDKLIWYSAKKGITQRTDRQYFLLGKWEGQYTPITEQDIVTLIAMIPARPEYPKILLDPDLWHYENDVVQKVIADYHAALEQWTVDQQAFAEFVADNYLVFKAHFVLSACNQYKIGSLSCVWLPYEGTLKQAYLDKLFATLSGAYTTLQDMTAKIKIPIKILP